MVFGDKKPYPVALLFPKEKGITDEKNIRKYLDEMNKHLPKHEQIRRFRIVPKPLEGTELTPTMKVKRELVKKKYETVIKQLYGQDI